MKKKYLLVIWLPVFYATGYASSPFAIPKIQEPPTKIPTTVRVEPVINCNYPIPANIQTIDPAILEAWAQAALMQSFEFNARDLDTQLEQLKPCFTEQGFQSFYDALKASGNIDEIKAQNLTISSQVNGKLSITPIRDNQWKVIIPLQVIYQNDKQKITQLLLVELLVGRRAAGNLAIMQVIATPKE